MDPIERKERINIILQEWNDSKKSVQIKISKKAKKSRPRIVKIYFRPKKTLKDKNTKKILESVSPP